MLRASKGSEEDPHTERRCSASAMAAPHDAPRKRRLTGSAGLSTHSTRKV